MRQPAFSNYHVSGQLAGCKLVAALRHWRPEDSWSQAKRLVHNRHVQINGNLCTDETRPLKAGDVVKVWHEPVAGPVRAEDVRIQYLDAHLVVVEKPAGVTTLRHSEERNWSEQRRQFQPTLDEMLRQILARKTKSSQRSARGRRPETPSIRPVHRLDRDTSGLMVFARTAEAERRLVQWAIAHGQVQAQTIESYLIRDRGDGLRGSGSQSDDGQRAVTHVRPLEYLENYTLVECRLETGRTHQIRIHLAEAGHMVCGEKIYVRRLNGKPMKDRSGATRQALHAAELGFLHPITGQRLDFQMPLPEDMKRLLQRLRGPTAPEPKETR
ncbi:MAG: pseudouridine synthase [Pirellulaceae bacterium]|nr:pseudouridine synthase [Pirellulaceae bacterium]